MESIANLSNLIIGCKVVAFAFEDNGGFWIELDNGILIEPVSIDGVYSGAELAEGMEKIGREVTKVSAIPLREYDLSPYPLLTVTIGGEQAVFSVNVRYEEALKWAS